MHKKRKLIKSIFINLFFKIDNLITQNLLSVIHYQKSNARFKNKKKIYLNQSIHKVIDFSKDFNSNIAISCW